METESDNRIKSEQKELSGMIKKFCGEKNYDKSCRLIVDTDPIEKNGTVKLSEGWKPIVTGFLLGFSGGLQL